MELPAASITASEGVFFPPSRKRFQEKRGQPSSVLCIDQTGMISTSSEAARALLEYATDVPLEACFFSLVHSKNQYRVMRDVADMIVYGKRTAEWFIRLRTGHQRWQWYRATAHNESGAADPRIVIHLHGALAQ